MWTEAGPARRMRAALRAQLPPRALLKRDRSEALFVTNAPALDPNLRLTGFSLERRGGLWAALPDESWVNRAERAAPPEGDLLCAQLARFRGARCDREALLLFARGAKLLDEARPAAADWAAFDRALRQRAALALRGGCGGALYASALFSARIQEKIEREMFR